MKIITIEEHVSDRALAQACQQAQAAEAAYFGDWAKASKDGQNPSTENIPKLVSAATAMAGVANMGAERIAEMDKNGIDMQILSYSNSPQLLPAEAAIPLVQAANDRLGKTIKAYPTRFGAFATLPWSDPQAAVQELQRTVRQLGFSGALLTGRPGDTFLDDPKYAPILAMAEALDVPIYMHPGVPAKSVQEKYYAGFTADVTARFSMFGWGWHAEAGVQIVRMILAGIFDQFPKLQIIAGHWGEMVPFYLARMDDTLPPSVTGLSRTISETFVQHVYVTPSGMLNQPHFDFTLNVMGAERIIYAVDYPYLTNTGARDFLENAPITAQQKALIGHGNAERLFKL